MPRTSLRTCVIPDLARRTPAGASTVRLHRPEAVQPAGSAHGTGQLEGMPQPRAAVCAVAGT